MVLGPPGFGLGLVFFVSLLFAVLALFHLLFKNNGSVDDRSRGGITLIQRRQIYIGFKRRTRLARGLEHAIELGAREVIAANQRDHIGRLLINGQQGALDERFLFELHLRVALEIRQIERGSGFALHLLCFFRLKLGEAIGFKVFGHDLTVITSPTLSAAEGFLSGASADLTLESGLRAHVMDSRSMRPLLSAKRTKVRPVVSSTLVTTAGTILLIGK